MYKNQLQELAQRSCFNLPSYACIREGPDHAPRFRASVNFNGEIFECSSYCTTLRQAEHAAAEVALNVLSTRGPSRSLTARILDETGIYKNLLQETAHRAGLKLPVYTTVRSGPGHIPIFTCIVELAGMNFKGEPAKTKKQAEKNAAISAWSTLKKMPNVGSVSKQESGTCEEQDQVIVAKVLSNFRERDDEAKQVFRREQSKSKAKMVRGHQKNLLELLMESLSESSTPKQNYVSLVPPPPPRTSSKILPPISSRSMPIRVRERSLVQTPMEEHQKDKEEWLSGNSIYRSFNPKIENTQIRNRSIGSSNSCPKASLKAPIYNGEIPTPIEEHQRDEEEWLGGGSSVYRSFKPRIENAQTRSRLIGSSNSCPKAPMYNGGFNPHRFAPAVQIRSVIPVCAAPPPSIKPTKEESLHTSSSNGSSKTVAESSSSSKFINPFTSEFNNKLQL